MKAIRQLLQHARVGMGGATEDGSLLAFPVASRGEIVCALCWAWHDQRTLVLTTVEEEELGEGPFGPVRPTMHAARGLKVFMIFEGKRHPITNALVIGRGKDCDIRIRDGNISRKHAAVVRRDDVFYIKDLGSTHGIVYRGLRIDNKRIDEGDVFQLGEYELAFTFNASD